VGQRPLGFPGLGPGEGPKDTDHLVVGYFVGDHLTIADPSIALERLVAVDGASRARARASEQAEGLAHRVCGEPHSSSDLSQALTLRAQCLDDLGDVLGYKARSLRIARCLQEPGEACPGEVALPTPERRAPTPKAEATWPGFAVLVRTSCTAPNLRAASSEASQRTRRCPR